MLTFASAAAPFSARAFPGKSTKTPETVAGISETAATLRNACSRVVIGSAADLCALSSPGAPAADIRGFP